MTRKSQARLARDAAQARLGQQLKTNKCWDEVNGIYQNCVAMLMQNMALVNLGRNEGLVLAVADKPTLAANLRLLAQDLRTMNDELTQIQTNHKDKSGGGKTPDEMMLSIQIYELYATWLQKYDGVVQPTVLHIAEAFDLAEQRLNAALVKQSATDPNVITDVEVKEIVATETVEVKEVRTGEMFQHVSEQPPAAAQ